MTKFLFKAIPRSEELLKAFSLHYPEAHPLSLYTHMWVRLMGSTVEDAVDSFMSLHGVSSGRYLIMMILEFRPEGMKPSEIASYLSVTQATVTGLIDGLEKTGWAKRKEHQKDRRACVVVLTDKGRKFISKVRPDFNLWLGEAYSGLQDDEKLQLISLIEKCFKSMAEKRPPEPQAPATEEASSAEADS